MVHAKIWARVKSAKQASIIAKYTTVEATEEIITSKIIDKITFLQIQPRATRPVMKQETKKETDKMYISKKVIYKLIETCLGRHQVSNPDLRAIHPINFTGYLHINGNVMIIFILEETQETVRFFTRHCEGLVDLMRLM